MVQFINENSGLNQLAQSFGEGITHGLTSALDGFYKQKDLIQKFQENQLKQREKLTKNLGALYKEQESNPSPGSKKNIRKKAEDLIGEGYSAYDAANLAYEEAFAKNGAEFSQNSENSNVLEKVGESIPGVAAKFGRSIPQAGDFVANLLRKAFSNTLTPEGKEFAQSKDTLTNLYDELTNNQGVPQNSLQSILSASPLGIGGVGATAAGEGLNALGLEGPGAEVLSLLAGLAAHKGVPRGPKKTGAELLKVPKTEAAQKIGKIAEEKIPQAPELSKKVSATPVEAGKIAKKEKGFFNKSEAIKERELFGQRLATKPLGEYLKEEAPSKKTEATLAKEAAKKEQLIPEENKKWEELNKAKQELRDLQTNKSGESAEKVNSLKVFKERQINKLYDDLRDIRYELKYGKKRMTDAELSAQAEKRADKFYEDAKTPTEETIKDLQNDLKKDEKFLKEAENNIRHGLLPGEVRPDTFLRIQDAYIKAYEGKIAALRERSADIGKPTHKGAMAEKSAIINTLKHLQDRVNRLKANQVNHREKIKALNALNKPASGAFYKNQLKETQKALHQFQKDFFSEKKATTPSEIKSEKVAKEKISREKIPEAAAKKLDEVKEAVTQFKESLKKSEEKSKNVSQENKQIKPLSHDVERLIKIAKGAVKLGIPVGIIQAEFEEFLGFKPTNSVIHGLLGISGVASLGITKYTHDFVRNVFDQRRADRLKKLRNNPDAYSKMLREISKDFGPARARKIVKLMENDQEE